MQQVKILLVEDDEDDVLLIEDFIDEGMNGVQVTTNHVLSYAEAMYLLEKELFDVYIFDYMLGEVDGLELLRAVRAKGIKTPVIFLTGHGDEEVAVKAMKFGATDYLTKEKLSAEAINLAILGALEIYKKENKRKKTEQAFLKLILGSFSYSTRQMDMFRIAHNLSKQAVILADLKGRVHYANPAAKDLIARVFEQNSPEELLAGLIKKELNNVKQMQCIEYNGLSLCVYAVPGSNNRIIVLLNGASSKRNFSCLKEILTKREIQILELINQGMNNKEIACRLCVSPNTVKRHLDNTFRKLKVSSRTELLIKAYQLVDDC